MVKMSTYEVDEIREMHLGVQINVYNLCCIDYSHLDRFVGGGLVVVRISLNIEHLGWGSHGWSQLLLRALLWLRLFTHRMG